MQHQRQIILKEFIRYKFFNSLFVGLSVGSIFTIYAPLEPSLYSLGGIALALAMLGIAKIYTKIMNIHYFYRISIAVELVMLISVLYFLFFSYSYTTALFIYAGYQLTFSFGSYLVRAETILIPKSEALSRLDVAKQLGYLTGMSTSYLFYKMLTYFLNIADNQSQVYELHYLLLITELITIVFLLRSFSNTKETVDDL